MLKLYFNILAVLSILMSSAQAITIKNETGEHPITIQVLVQSRTGPSEMFLNETRPIILPKGELTVNLSSAFKRVEAYFGDNSEGSIEVHLLASGKHRGGEPSQIATCSLTKITNYLDFLKLDKARFAIHKGKNKCVRY